jgi:hypothetical protein
MEGAAQEQMATTEMQQKIYNTMKAQLKVSQAALLKDAAMIQAIRESAQEGNEEKETP